MRFPSKNLSSILFLTASLIVALLTIAMTSSGQTIRKPESSPACGNGLALQVGPAPSTQGSLLRVTLRSKTPLVEVQGAWGEQRISFWQDDAQPDQFRAFLGIDVELAPGPHDFTVDAKLAGGAILSCRATVMVKSGRFAVERLKVAPKFVEPSPEDAERAKKEGERLHAIYTGPAAAKMWAGAFRFPLDGPRRGGNFGRRRVLNGEPRSPHGGLDVPAGIGTPVHATQRGRVALAAELYYAGNTVVVDHGLGLYTFYGHLSAISVKEGDIVESGGLVGRVGATGRVTGPHLHWGLIVNESKVNPLQILPAQRARKQ